MRTLQQQHRDTVQALSSDAYDVGTYDADTLERVEFSDGYQVTFYQVGACWSDEVYTWLVEFFQDMGDGRTYLGKFEGTPEISFKIRDRRTALQLARDYNQISVWDWANGCEIATGGTGIAVA